MHYELHFRSWLGTILSCNEAKARSVTQGVSPSIGQKFCAKTTHRRETRSVYCISHSQGAYLVRYIVFKTTNELFN
ncbi:unnamed protein product [Ixodes pacificus]